MASEDIPDFALPDVITALRAELKETADQYRHDPWFKYSEVTLRVSLLASRKKGGKVQFTLAGIGGGFHGDDDRTHGIEITMKLELLGNHQLGGAYGTDDVDPADSPAGIASGGQPPDA